jgi:hypothetical protein
MKIKTFILLSTERWRELDSKHDAEKSRSNGPDENNLRMFNNDGAIAIDCHTSDILDFERESGRDVDSDVIESEDLFFELCDYLHKSCGLESEGFGASFRPHEGEVEPRSS